jgi:hypothetical protein
MYDIIALAPIWLPDVIKLNFRKQHKAFGQPNVSWPVLLEGWPTF